ncbi:MAG TPA: HEPN domain-containing protein [Thermoproteales archaeon]|nr:HEPN domain-containing protein [Thermoproteales archaeon]
MKFNPRSETEYRRKLARGFLKDARELFKVGDWRNNVANSQLAAENSAKTIISFYKIPSWSHDPLPELNEVVGQLPLEARRYAEELALMAHQLAPEHARTTYGDLSRGLTPWELYSREDAEKSLKKAEKAVKLMEKI